MELTSYILGKKAGGGGQPNLQSKDVSITENGETTVTADSGYDGLSEVDIETNVQPDLESKSVTITENTTTTITPTSGKDGISSVSVTTNVPAPKIYPKNGLVLSDRGLTTIDLRALDISQMTSLSKLFNGCTAMTGVDLSGLDTSDITSFNQMFLGCSSLTGAGVDLSVLDTTSLTDIGSMFKNCTSLTSIDLSDFDTSRVKTFNGLFYGCTSLTSIDLSDLDTSSATNCSDMFYGCTSLDNADISTLNLSSSSMSQFNNVFRSCTNLKTFTLPAITSTTLYSFNFFFYQDEGITGNIDLDNWNITLPSSTKFYFQSMFTDAKNVKKISMKNMVGAVSNISYMFSGCTSLEEIDIRGLTLDTAGSGFRTDVFGNASDVNTKVPASCLIIVKDSTQKSFVRNNYSWLTNVKTPSEL